MPRISKLADLDNPQFQLTVVALLVRKLGGKVTLTQNDFDMMFGEILGETIDEDGYTLELRQMPGVKPC